MLLDSRNSETPAASFTIGLEAPGHDREIKALTDRAFGPGRYAKTAERLREGANPLADMSFMASHEGRVIGSVRLWPITVTDDVAGTSETIAFLGPIVVDEAFRSAGLGKRLIALSLEAAALAGLRAVLLVGDATYFASSGFVRADGISLPGPVDPKRVLIHFAQAGDSLTGRVGRA